MYLRLGIKGWHAKVAKVEMLNCRCCTKNLVNNIRLKYTCVWGQRVGTQKRLARKGAKVAKVEMDLT